MNIKHALPLAVILAALPLEIQHNGGAKIGISEANAQQMGSDPWNYSRGSRGFWANYQAIRRSQQDIGGDGSGAEVSYYLETTNTNVSSTAIANQSIVNQTLGDGATGMVGTNLNQASAGDQTADTSSSTDITDNSTNTVAGE